MIKKTFTELNEATVVGAFIFLLSKKEDVTTLDVKDFLRSQGYWAIQEEVSDYIDSIYEKSRYDEIYLSENGSIVKRVSDNGRYNIYTLFEDDEDIPDENDEQEALCETVVTVAQNTETQQGASLRNRIRAKMQEGKSSHQITREVNTELNLTLDSYSIRAYMANITRRN